jgi:predicted nucleotidyltransferase
VEIQETLSHLTGVLVDLVHRPDLKPHIGEGILEAVIIV